MADLIDRLAGTATDRPKLPVHQFIAGLRLYAAGLATKAEIAADWDLQGDEATQAAALATVVDGKGTAANKALYALQVDAVCMLLEHHQDHIVHNADGTVNKAKVKTLLGIA